MDDRSAGVYEFMSFGVKVFTFHPPVTAFSGIPVEPADILRFTNSK